MIKELRFRLEKSNAIKKVKTGYTQRKPAQVSLATDPNQLYIGALVLVIKVQHKCTFHSTEMHTYAFNDG
jgi:hypothetical protein